MGVKRNAKEDVNVNNINLNAQIYANVEGSVPRYISIQVQFLVVILYCYVTLVRILKGPGNQYAV